MYQGRVSVKNGLAVGLGILIMVSSAACVSQEDPNRRAKQGAEIGAAAGALAGAIIGNQSGNPRTGALLGAALGAGIGGVVGHRRDKMAADMARIQQVEVQRQQAENELKLIVNDQILFDVNSSVLRISALPTLNQIADVLNRYPDARVVVTGYTDSTGTEAYNSVLSQRRAKSVSNYLISRGVDAARITAVGLGESDPIDTNQTAQGRQHNRRVEFFVKLPPQEG
jgi:outer membrane protein OmpA-like peptidoglycan-associated protein